MVARKSPIAAAELGITYYRLISLLRSKKLPPPQKDSSGDYLWVDADLAAARKALGVDHRSRGNAVEENGAAKNR